ncbi:hypothetical protein B808_1093 [Fructilactobacillus florum 8D]|uniref:Uncharacterized protein n=2 Tax=Fructilactobacillus florum TaxID=640331 RepID=W9EG77_9LACO|nr:tetratricopeptide repeat protein [Fructilactobacillus florum]EKK20302.1 hypothetical protein B807_941 [Fructilactobacillus florum 2F]ETO39985.1 hypothetical protein B808_1093 [Fructilactobacillus florum 8D]KRM91663.1 hypothetical protein FC87_GL000800 [Fructilactobacillus florum DSM 22689 = JCM 16035]
MIDKPDAHTKQQQAEATLHQLVQDIDNHPHDYRPYYDLSVLLIELHSYTQAEELLVKALGLFQDRSRTAKNLLTYGLGNVYYSAGQYQKAITEFQQVNDQQLQHDAYLMLAQSYMGEHDYQHAVAFLLTAQETSRQDPTVNRLLGQSLLALGDFKQAASFYDQVLQAQPQDLVANFDRGLIALVLGATAEPYFEKVKTIDPQYYSQQQQRITAIKEQIKAKQQRTDS